MKREAPIDCYCSPPVEGCARCRDCRCSPSVAACPLCSFVDEVARRLGLAPPTRAAGRGLTVGVGQSRSGTIGAVGAVADTEGGKS